MGRGKDPRNILLGKAPTRTAPKFLLHEDRSETAVYRYYTDTDGQPVIRDYEDRKEWVEEEIRDGYTIRLYKYEDESLPTYGDYSKLVVERKKINPLTKEVFHSFRYSDDDIFIYRSVEDKDIPVYTSKNKDGDRQERRNWIEGDNVFSKIISHTGEEKHEKTEMNHQAHSINDKPSEIHIGLGEMSKETWHRKGDIHRESGPAIIVRVSGKLYKEKWYQNGEVFRENAPAKIKYYLESNNSLERVEYRKKVEWEGEEYVVPGNPDGPTVIEYDKNGVVQLEAWCEFENPEDAVDNRWRSDFYHRDSSKGPAKIFYDPPTGAKITCYLSHNNNHRLDGPAVIEENGDGEIIREEYWISGGRLASKEEWEESVRLLTDTAPGEV